jgi:hypothetical protein
MKIGDDWWVRVNPDEARRVMHALQNVLAHAWPAPGSSKRNTMLWLAASINLVALVARAAGLEPETLVATIRQEWARLDALDREASS